MMQLIQKIDMLDDSKSLFSGKDSNNTQITNISIKFSIFHQSAIKYLCFSAR